MLKIKPIVERSSCLYKHSFCIGYPVSSVLTMYVKRIKEATVETVLNRDRDSAD